MPHHSRTLAFVAAFVARPSFFGLPGSQRCVAVTPEGGTTAIRQGAGDVPRDPGNWERFRVELLVFGKLNWL
jgi:hypothetical protein